MARSAPNPAAHPSLGSMVRARRQKAGWTLARLAQACGLAKSYLSMIENDKVAHPPSPRAVAALARALDDRDGELAAAARWDATPPEVRRRVARLQGDIDQAHAAGRWLKSSGGDLDALWRTGQLHAQAQRQQPPQSSSPAHAPDANADPDPAWPPTPPGASPPRPIPLINKVAAGEPGGYTDLGYPAGVAELYLSLPGITDPDAFGCTVIGDSMAPAYAAGDLVVFSPLAAVVDGCDVFARLHPEHQSTFKRVYFEDPDRIRLQPLNPRHAPRVLHREAVAQLIRAVRRISAL